MYRLNICKSGEYLVNLDLAGKSVLIYNNGRKPFQEALSS